MSAHTHDDGFHEIQLNGKQLVFLFMAATVVSVVIFLCGVFVGRGVRAERTVLAQTETANQAPMADTGSSTPANNAPAAVGTAGDPRAAQPPPTVDDLSYPKRLEQGEGADDLRPSRPAPAKAVQSPAPAAATPQPAQTPVVKPAAEQVPVIAPAPRPAPAAVTNPAQAPPSPPTAPASAPAAPGSGYAVQVAALNVRSEADAIAKRLSSKGYSAYVQAPSGTTSVFRVRVGAFKTRHEAETVAAKLQKEEQFKPWITR